MPAEPFTLPEAGERDEYAFHDLESDTDTDEEWDADCESFECECECEFGC